MNETEKVEQTPVEEKVEQVVEPTPVELEAREQGWVSKDEWVESGREESEWRPAKEFVERGDLYRTIHSTKRELRQTQAALTALQRHHQYVFEKAHAQALQELKSQKRQAIRNEDMEEVAAIEDEIERREQEYHTEKQAQTQVAQATQAASQGVHPDFQAWQSRNQWYTNDPDLREFADATGMVYASKNPGVNPVEVLQYVEQKVKKQFPDKFGSRKATAPSPTASVNRQSTSRSVKDDGFQLDEMERQIMDTLVKTGTMTEAEYKAELKKAKGL